MDDQKNIHVVLTMRVLGEEGWTNTMEYNFTSIEMVKKLQAAIAEALLKLNK